MSSSRIFKYPLRIVDVQDVEMPVGATILSAIEQYGGVVVYAQVSPDLPKTQRRFYIAGTGHPMDSIPDSASYVGTVSTDGGSLIWHVFDGGPVA